MKTPKYTAGKLMESLVIASNRHAGENQHPVNNHFDRLPVAPDALSSRDISHILWVASARMTISLFHHGILTKSLLGLVFVSLSFTVQAQAEFGRLYTTPSQRLKLDELRNKRPQQEIVVDLVQDDIGDITEEETAPVLMNSITLNGLVYRRDGKSTAWINRNSTNTGNIETQFTTVTESDIGSNQVQIMLPDNRTNIRLKVGQQYDVHSQQVYDVVNDPVTGSPVTVPGVSRETR